MKFYLSSYMFGDSPEKLKAMIPANPGIGLIYNARDYVGSDPVRNEENQKAEMAFLDRLGFKTEAIDLKQYFGKEDALREKLNSFGAVWVSGGNTFVLRQAMHLSGFENIIKEIAGKGDFLYGGYSAGICVLAESLRSLFIVDEPYNYPYAEMTETIWEGLGFFKYDFMPHYDSDHIESEKIGNSIQYCIDNKILFRALRDGEVIIIE